MDWHFGYISGFISFPAESFDLYGSFIGMIENPVKDSKSSLIIAHLSRDSLPCDLSLSMEPPMGVFEYCV